MRVYNTGEVVLTQRYLAAFSVSLNMRDYPFDSQTLSWDVRSTMYNRSAVRFLPASPPALAASSLLLQGVSDTDWTFSKYGQAVYTIDSGIFVNYDLLSISITATRISTMSSSFIILPICLICAALCLELFMDTAESSRIQTPLACITATMGFSFVVADLCPPVSYNTRMHLMIFQTYIFSVIALVCNGLLFYVEMCRQRLSASHASMKTLLADSHEVANRLRHHNLCGDKAGTPACASAPGPTGQQGTLGADSASQELNGEADPGTAARAAPSPPAARDSSRETVSEASGTLTYVHGASFGSAKDPEAALSSTPEWAGSGSDGPPPSDKSEKTGAFRNGDGAFHDVRDLLAAPEAETFRRLEWGGGPVRMFFGCCWMTTANADWWNRWVGGRARSLDSGPTAASVSREAARDCTNRGCTLASVPCQCALPVCLRSRLPVRLRGADLPQSPDPRPLRRQARGALQHGPAAALPPAHGHLRGLHPRPRRPHGPRRPRRAPAGHPGPLTRSPDTPGSPGTGPLTRQ